ncbi:MAG TPA: patatin-like phospholipase family protein [Vicinamibacteria bacterium]|nr:patatin-like phospholipase family protein [Vicinamibacteria bacterium]
MSHAGMRVLFVSLALAAGLAGAQESASQPPARPRIALALSGGGARGMAHIGVLRAFEDAGLPVDASAANSMGAVVGGVYATGRTAAELEDVVRSMDWASLFSGRADRRTIPVVRRDDRYGDLFGVRFDGKGARLPGGLLAEHRVNRFLIEHLAPPGYAVGGDFDRLPIPFRAVATDLANGERVILSRGDLARAVRASMSIPVFFPPVTWEGRVLVDGLVVDNLPTGVARTFDAAVTVAVDVGSPEMDPEEYETSLGVASQVSDLLGGRRNRDFRAEPDVYVRPDLGKHSATEYSGFGRLIRAGYEAGSNAVPEIRAKLAAAGVVDLSPRPRPAADRTLEGAPIAEVVVRGNERVSARLVRRTFNIPTGRGFVMQRGLRAFDKIDATGLLDRTWMEFEPVPEGVRIVLRGKDATPNRAAVGIAYTEWEKARASLRLRNQNTLGFGEQVELLGAVSDAETLGQASLRGDRLFLVGLGYRASVYTFTDKPRFFDTEGHEVNRARYKREGGALTLRAGLERWGIVEAGVRFGHVKTVPQAGLAQEEAKDGVGQVFGGFAVDTLDDLFWPRAGARLALDAEWNLDSMGATHPFWRARVEGRLGRRVARRTTLQMDGLLGVSGNDLPVYDHFRIGGPMLVPGYRFEELKGPQALAGALALRYRALGSLELVTRIGAGDVFDDRDSIRLGDLRWGASVGLYYPSRIGPMSLEVGVRDGGGSVLSLAFGWN